MVIQNARMNKDNANKHKTNSYLKNFWIPLAERNFYFKVSLRATIRLILPFLQAVWIASLVSLGRMRSRYYSLCWFLCFSTRFWLVTETQLCLCLPEKSSNWAGLGLWCWLSYGWRYVYLEDKVCRSEAESKASRQVCHLMIMSARYGFLSRPRCLLWLFQIAITGAVSFSLPRLVKHAAQVRWPHWDRFSISHGLWVREQPCRG